MKKLSERLQDAYMVGNKDLIESLKKEAQDKAEQLQKKPTVTPLAINTVLNDDGSSAIKVYEFLDTAFGEDWWELEFETIERLLWVKYGTALDDINRDKIWSVKYLCNSQRPFLDWFLFNQVAVALAGAIADFEVLRTPTPGMLINAVDIMKQIRPEEPFSREVKKYISIILIQEGIYVPPPSLLELIGEEFEVLISNPNKEEWQAVYNKYKEMIESKKYDVQETALDIQARRLLVAEEAANTYAK
jgi:hypothetical protein